MRIPKLFCPGPVMTEESVRKTLLHHDICHRGKEFESLFEDLQEKIKLLLGADSSFYSLIISGSGTAANEAVLSSLFAERESVIYINNGEFGNRLREIIDKNMIPNIPLEFPWATLPNLEVVESTLISHPETKAVAMVFHESSCGMINPVREVGALCKKYGKILFVDCISAAGAEHIDMVQNNIDIVTSVSGKCIGAYPGASFVCAKESILANISAEQCKNVYLSLYKHYKFAKEKRQTPNTPNLTLFWPLQRAIEGILEDGLDKRITRFQTHSAYIRASLKSMGLRLLIEEHTSNVTTSFFLPKGHCVKEFLDFMEDHGFILVEGKGVLGENGMVQLGVMGNVISLNDCHDFIKTIQMYLDMHK